MTGRMVSHYRILSPLGSGGMGVVYLAEDERLGRQVALKFLPTAWSHERKALERFRVEARAASSLSHPAICAIYDIGEDGEVPFIVMEALKGETLRDRIARGPLKVTEVLDIGIQLADALGAAHDQGIVHRDIKPANIFLTDKNRVKVLDFGLAKLTSSASHLTSGADTTSPATMHTVDNQITIPGTALGTVSYMSPEQARGEDVDARTDLFSLGAVLYEMATGTQAFGGSTTAVVYDAILNRAPRPIARLNPLVPPRLEALIATALEKDREYRQQHASDLEAELKRIRRDLDSGASHVSAPMMPPAVADTIPVMTVPPVPAPSPPRRRSELIAVLFAVVAVAAAGLWVFRDAIRSGQAPPAEAVTASTSTTSTPAAPALPRAEENPTQPTDSEPPRASAVAPPPVAPAPRAIPRETPRSQAPIDRIEQPRAAETAPVRQPEPVPARPTGATRSELPSVRQSEPPAVRPEPSGRQPESQPAVPPRSAGSDVRPSESAPVPVSQPPPTPVAPAEVIAPPAPTPQPPPASASSPAPSANQAGRPPARESEPPPRAPVETDEAAIRAVIRTFARAIETKNLALYKSVRPRLSSADESLLRETFNLSNVQQQVDIRVDSIRVEGRTATARLTRRDTLTTGGRPKTSNSTPTMHFEKTEAGWIIAD